MTNQRLVPEARSPIFHNADYATKPLRSGYRRGLPYPALYSSMAVLPIGNGRSLVHNNADFEAMIMVVVEELPPSRAERLDRTRYDFPRVSPGVSDWFRVILADPALFVHLRRFVSL